MLYGEGDWCIWFWEGFWYSGPKNLIARLINFKQMYSQILKGVPASVKKIYCDNIFYAYYAKAFSF